MGLIRPIELKGESKKDHKNDIVGDDNTSEDVDGHEDRGELNVVLVGPMRFHQDCIDKTPS